MTRCDVTHLLDEGVALGHAPDGGERVLDDAHDGPVGLWRDQHAGRAGELRDLGARLQRLRDVQVHLVAVEVRVVRRRAAASQTNARVSREVES